jgi:hypothetical protein
MTATLVPVGNARETRSPVTDSMEAPEVMIMAVNGRPSREVMFKRTPFDDEDVSCA